jgi:ribonuclease BN (tRNA processing enzyme)
VTDRFAPQRPLVRTLFVTHLHADHIMDLANLIQGSWPSHVIDVFGPGPAGLPIPTSPGHADQPLAFPDDPTPGTRGTVDHLLRAFAYNINLRVARRLPNSAAIRNHLAAAHSPPEDVCGVDLAEHTLQFP